ncbi:Flp pilus assembly protein CpaB [Oryzomonas rubra]|uniref:Flp pilus assembly protein CpaB n=1 Tax=Oryzomonas rubra TaxID=2509454 RepID=A0A5A9XDD1_9BACT|nr:Flp pilus assembly protein CpaB [Oryzomonas rubra]KAA0890455.1 Flp pilus assembly protein CpaB [Oryzomonas rubra]
MNRSQAVTMVTLIALVFAGVASWGVYSYLKQESLKTKQASSFVIMVAAGDIPIGTKLNETHLKPAGWPKDNVPAGSFTDAKSLVNRVAIRNLSAGDAITEQKLMPKEGSAAATGVMTYIIPQGHRAVTVGVNEVAGVAGFIAPNNRVDVVLTTQIPNNSNEMVTKIILQNVPVLATGQITDQKDGKPVLVPTVTMDLTPEDSEKLVHASRKGSLQLLLRNIIDTAQVDVKGGATISTVLGGVERPVIAVAQAKPAQAKLAQVRRPVRRAAPEGARAAIRPLPAAPQGHKVTVIDGGARTTKEFVLQ